MDLVNNILELLIGLAVFVFGMNTMANGLEKSLGSRLKKVFDKIGDNRIVGVGIGSLVAASTQSSAATTSIVIGLVNAGTLTLIQATSIIMGANIGTTVTGLLVSLSSLNFTIFFSLFAFVGVVFSFSKKPKIKEVAQALTGFGLMFIGLSLVKNAFLEESIKNVCVSMFNNITFPLLLVLLGVLITALIQSSSSLTGLVIIMVGSGIIPVKSALFIVLGSNIGTCVTALISASGANANAKRSAAIHLLFNVIGSIIFTAFIWIFSDFIVDVLNVLAPGNNSIQIALFHIVFNVVTTLLLLPFANQLVKIASMIIKDKELEKRKQLTSLIDSRFLETPFIAISQAKKEIQLMATLSKENLKRGFDCILNNDYSESELINSKEDDIDYLNIEITQYLIKLTSSVSDHDAKKCGSYFHVLNDIERIGDIAVDFLDICKAMKDKSLSFSDTALLELNGMYQVIEDMFEVSLEIFAKKNRNNIKKLDELEKISDNKKDELDAAHFERLSKDNCTIELGAYYTSIAAYLERVADHLVNIGYSIFNPTGDQK